MTFCLGRVVDRRFDRVGQFFADLRRQVDVDFDRRCRRHGRPVRRRRRGGSPARLAGRARPAALGRRRRRGRRCVRAAGLARVEMDAAIVDQDVGFGLVPCARLRSARTIDFVAAGKQFVLQDRGGDQGQRPRTGRTSTTTAGDPGGGRVEAAVQRGQQGGKRLLKGVLACMYTVHSAGDGATVGHGGALGEAFATGRRMRCPGLQPAPRCRARFNAPWPPAGAAEPSRLSGSPI